jgi:hypothetical protein
MSLLPQKVLQAAEADLMRRIRNKACAQRGTFELYAFHREHIRKAKTIRQLVVTALMQPELGMRSKKRNTRMLYGDGALLVKALRMLRTNYDNGVYDAQIEEFV